MLAAVYSSDVFLCFHQELLSRLHLPLMNKLKLYTPDMDEPSEEETNGEE